MLLNLHNAWLPSQLYTLYAFSALEYLLWLAHHNLHMNVFVFYLLIKKLFVDNIHFFKFLSMTDKTITRPAKNYYYYSYSRGTSFSESFHRYKEGKYPVLRTNTKPQQLIKHTKISYSIASLVFRKFSCVIYRNDVNRGTSKLSYSKYLKKYGPC